MLAVAGIGWVAGSITARWRIMTLASIPRQVALSDNPAEKARILAKGRVLATALKNDPRAVLSFGEACLFAADDAPRQTGYFANAAVLLAGLGQRLADEPQYAFWAESHYAQALSEIGRNAEALAALARADKALSKMPDGVVQRALRLTLVNHQAYILATAASRHIRNPEKALHLAQVMISAKDVAITGEMPSASAAFVDTLAAAWFAAGQVQKALETQTLALGLAKPGDISVYLEHYDLYAQTSLISSPRLMALVAKRK